MGMVRAARLRNFTAVLPSFGRMRAFATIVTTFAFATGNVHVSEATAAFAPGGRYPSRFTSARMFRRCVAVGRKPSRPTRLMRYVSLSPTKASASSRTR